MTEHTPLSADERRLRRSLRDDLALYARRCLRIRPKDGGLAPLRLNGVQRRLHALIEAQRRRTGQFRALVVKARQLGCSTYVQARFFWRVTHGRGLRVFILTHRQETSDSIFATVGRFYRHCPAPFRPDVGISNGRELVFHRLDSSYRVATAGAADVGRSDTVQSFHGSEVAFWPNAEDHVAGMLQAVPDGPGSEVILESTGNGPDGMFHNLCRAAQRGSGGYALIFIP